jgi:hypothetical protein
MQVILHDKRSFPLALDSLATPPITIALPAEAEEPRRALEERGARHTALRLLWVQRHWRGAAGCAAAEQMRGSRRGLGFWLASSVSRSLLCSDLGQRQHAPFIPNMQITIAIASALNDQNAA